MKKLASDLTLPSDLFLIGLISSLAFFLGGLLGGTLLLVSEWPWGYLLEGAVGGLLLGLFLRRRYQPWLPMIGGAISITVAVLASFLLSWFTNIAAIIPAMISGAIAGLIFGAILNARAAVWVFSLTGAVGFGLGKMVIDWFIQTFTVLYDWLSLTAGGLSGAVLTQGLYGLVHGLTFGLAIIMVVFLHRKELIS